MSNGRLEKLLNQREKERQAVEAFNPAREIEAWNAQLENLYLMAETFLKPYTAAARVKISYEETAIREEQLGTYTCQRMIIDVGGSQVLLSPIGTLLVGSKGRVDMEGIGGQARLLLLDRNATNARSLIRITVGQKQVAPETPANIDWVWKFASSPPNIEFTNLSEESFLDRLATVAGG